MSSANQIRCNGCREWFTADNPACPDCGHPRPAYNKWLRTAQLNENLYKFARSADKEAKFARARGLG